MSARKTLEDVTKKGLELDAGDAQPAVAEEIGDLLFAVVNLARHAGVEAETALRGANLKFERRFHAVEQALAAQGKRPEQATLDEMDALWERSKHQ